METIIKRPIRQAQGKQFNVVGLLLVSPQSGLSFGYIRMVR
jgi:hypothetical protein